ncbi:MAG: YeeE/YedE family protein [Steroidobacteraceae bacterium]|jgi:uncharacterized membrane protein YedE/YeeE
MNTANLIHSLGGGLLIGTGVAVLLLLNGRVAGISGITANVLRGFLGPQASEAAFLVGLLLPAVFAGVGEPTMAGGLPLLAVSGLLVGFGTQMGGGCTSGHGVCGIAHLSRRSLAATAAFMTTAMLTVAVVRHGWSS